MRRIPHRRVPSITAGHGWAWYSSYLRITSGSSFNKTVIAKRFISVSNRFHIPVWLGKKQSLTQDPAGAVQIEDVKRVVSWILQQEIRNSIAVEIGDPGHLQVPVCRRIKQTLI